MSTKNRIALVENNETLDPKDWAAMRQLGHQMMDDMMDYLENIAQQPVWKPIPPSVKTFLKQDIPQEGQNIDDIYAEFKAHILPYAKGNIHPRFWAFVQGTGTPLAVLADMLASAMNSNVTIGEHSAMYVDKQVVDWCKQMMHYPATASGILVSGGSMANITALTIARNHQLEKNIRKNGILGAGGQMTLYCSTETHSCIQKASEIIGIGTDGVRKISVNDHFEMQVEELIATIEADIQNGCVPFCIVATTGTVNTGAIDPLNDILKICKKYNLWLHIDGAYGALAKLDPQYADALKGIEQADSVAFDLHKWLYIPYEVGCTLVKNADAHRSSFAVAPSYLVNFERGLSAGPDPLNNYGFELSRGFKALKVWMSLKEHGLQKYVRMITQNNAQAEYLGNLIQNTPHLEVLAPVSMSIVCYRFIQEGFSLEVLNDLNKEILMALQERGIASPSSTILHNQFAIRVCIVNQRTKKEDLDILVKETVKIGLELVARY
jgi:aromatic-L-amino-acid/L-tryptophan decarboxylase